MIINGIAYEYVTRRVPIAKDRFAVVIVQQMARQQPRGPKPRKFTERSWQRIQERNASRKRDVLPFTREECK